MGSEDLDELMTEALRSYSTANPRPGMEQRVLNRLAAVRPRRTFLSWALGTAVAAVAVSVISLWISPFRTPVPQPQMAGHAAQAASTPSRELMTHPTRVAPVLNPETPLRHITPSATRRRLRIPDPLSEQEKALMALVERFPLQAQELLKSTEPQPMEPIVIDEISIPPLEENGQ